MFLQNATQRLARPIERRMKIAFVCGFAWEPKGTARARAFPLAVELANKGHEVAIFLTPYDNPGESGQKRELEGVHIVNVEVGARPGLRHAPLIARRLCLMIRKYAPEVVHVFKPKGYSGAACTWLLLRGCRAVALDCDDWEGWGGWNEVNDYPWLLKKYIDRQEKWLLRRAPVVTAASHVLARRAAALRGSANGVFYVPNCRISRTSVAAQEEVRAASSKGAKQSLGLSDALVILYSGHFEPGDDILFFCRAAAPVARRTGATIVFVGEGPEVVRVREFFSGETGVTVCFFPWLPYEKFVRLVAAADVAAFPYPDNAIYRAKCSVRIIDYMSMGKAVLTTAVGQNMDYIVDGESGILAPPGDEIKFAQELERLLQNPVLCAYLGRNARRRIKDKFSWDGDPIENCLTAYRQLSSI